MDKDIGWGPYVLGLLAIAGSVAVAVYLGYWQSERELEERAQIIAAEVLGRSHSISDQIDVAMKALEADAAGNACDKENIRLMRELAISASYLQAVGYVQDNRLMCSSYGHHGRGIPVGPPDYVSRLGYVIRASVRLPFAGDSIFLVSTHQNSGYSVFALPNLALDLMHDRSEIGIGLFGASSKKVLLHRGPVQDAWFSLPPDGMRATYRLDQNLIVVMRSSKYDYAAYAALPLAARNMDWLRYSFILVPLGFTSGLVEAALIVLLARRRRSLLYQLRQALRRDELFLLYQPIVDLHSGRWAAAEALVRWRRPDGSQIGPNIFIPLAERSDLMREITERVIDLVIQDAAAFLRHRPDFHISINFCSSDLSDKAAVEKLNQTLAQAGMRPESIVIEVTERALIDTDLARRQIRDMRARGHKIAIDDFGTGYCGLAYLTSLELDYLKIDKTFVDTIGTDAVTSQVVDHIIEIAKSLKLEMIAEGVETAGQADYLRAHGVQYAQGWLYAKAMPFKDLRSALK